MAGYLCRGCLSDDPSMHSPTCALMLWSEPMRQYIPRPAAHSSTQPSPSMASSQLTPKPLLGLAPRSASFATDLDELLNHIGTQLLECWRTVQMVRASLITGQVATPDTPTRKRKAGSSGRARSARPLAKSSKASTPKAAKAARSKGESRARFSLAEEKDRYLKWIRRTGKGDSMQNRQYWMNRWGNFGFRSYPTSSVGKRGRSAS